MVHIRRSHGETEAIHAFQCRFSKFCTCLACRWVLVCEKDVVRYVEDEVQGIDIYVDYK